jgi:hypothetical protein
MTDMVAVIAGTEYVYYDSVEAELDDFLPVKSIVFIPDYPDGTVPPMSEAVVKKWMDFADQDYLEADPNMIMMQAIAYEPAAEHVLIVMGTGDRETIEYAFSRGWDVFDLTRGLFPVTQEDLEAEDAEMPLDGPEINADSLAGESGMITHGTGSEPYNGSESHTWSREEIEKMMSGYIQVHEAKFHGVPSESVILEGITDMSAVPEMAEPVKIRCYKSKTGKIRKAGRSKMKPGETEVFLTDEELDATLEA